jgi:Ion channel
VIVIIAVGLLTMLACLVLQAVASVVAARYFARAADGRRGRHPWRSVFRQLSVLMLVLMLGNIVQIAIWALLYRLLGAFPEFETAMYFSGVTFTSLGYGDVVLDGRIRLLAPLQAANGLMMFGISTALFFAAIQRAMAKGIAERPPGA